MEIFGIKFSKNEVVFIFISLFLVILYFSMNSNKYIKKINSHYICTKKICIDYPYYTKCITFDKPEVLVCEKIKQYGSYQIIFKSKEKKCDVRPR